MVVGSRWPREQVLAWGMNTQEKIPGQSSGLRERRASLEGLSLGGAAPRPQSWWGPRAGEWHRGAGGSAENELFSCISYLHSGASKGRRMDFLLQRILMQGVLKKVPYDCISSVLGVSQRELA